MSSLTTSAPSPPGSGRIAAPFVERPNAELPSTEHDARGTGCRTSAPLAEADAEAAADGGAPGALAVTVTAAARADGCVMASPTDWRSLYWNHSRVSIGGRIKGRPG